MEKLSCDVVIVGAGPCGSMAAKTCAKYGLDTILVERKEYPSKPNATACLVDRRIFEYIQKVEIVKSLDEVLSPSLHAIGGDMHIRPMRRKLWA